MWGEADGAEEDGDDGDGGNDDDDNDDGYGDDTECSPESLRKRKAAAPAAPPANAPAAAPARAAGGEGRHLSSRCIWRGANCQFTPRASARGRLWLQL